MLKPAQQYWAPPGMSLLFEKPPDLPLIPRAGMTLTSPYVVMATDYDAALRHIETLEQDHAALRASLAMDRSERERALRANETGLPNGSST